MKYIVEESLTNFRFWAGAKDRAAMLTYDELEQVGDYLEQLGGEEPLTDTQVNDLFWFEFDFVVREILGYEYDEQRDEIIRNN